MPRTRQKFKFWGIFNSLVIVALFSACSGSNNNSGGSDENHPPTITGTPSQIAVQDTLYSFTPAANDPDGDTLSFSITNKPDWASFDSQTGELSGTPSTADLGSFSNIVISVTDGIEGVSLQAFAIQVDATSGINHPPTINGTPALIAVEGGAYSFTPTANDPNGDLLTFSIENKPGWASFDTQTGELSGTPEAADVGSFSNIVISVSDGQESASLQAFTIEVTAADINHPPTINGTPTLVVVRTVAYSFTPTANDPNGDLLTFSIENKPDWASFDSQTGTLSGTPGTADVGSFSNIVISVSDGTESTSLQAFTIDVIIGVLSVDVGTDQTIALPDTLTLNATVTEGGLPPQNSTTYSWSQLSGPGLGTIVFGDANAANTTVTIPTVGSYRVMLEADNSDEVVSDTLEITVNLKAAGNSALSDRPANAGECVSPAAPPTATSITLIDPYPDLPDFIDPLAMIMPPGDDTYWYVVQQTGEVVRFANNLSVSSSTTFIDISDRVIASGERGLLGMAFHPGFSTNGYVYLSYTNNDSGLVSRISRFELDGTGQALNPDSEEIILSVSQPEPNHNGGQIAFGPDGYLYIGFGDGGTSGDSAGHAQNVNTWLGAMLRIDVGDGSSAAYSIPADNPFATSGGLPEIFAWGFRNPWRWSFDRTTGDLWVGDVGQNDYEEIDIVTLGSNYGWNTMEGLHCYNTNSCDQSGLTPPVVEYDHSMGQSVTGGYRYRGSDISFLQGHYFYADYIGGTIWGLEETSPGQYTSTELADTSFFIASFAEDNSGELYVIDRSGRRAHKIVGETNGQTGQIPAQLSEWGCFEAVDTTKFSNRVIPYDINALLWSDHADKGRFMAIPDGTSIDVDAEGRFDYPVGSVIGKHFWLGNEIIETRLMLHHEQPHGWKGYSYEWDGSDASLLSGAKDKDFGNTSWHYPSSAECDACHTAISGFTLGPEVGQLNRSYHYDSTGEDANQLVTLENIGVMSKNFSDQERSTAFYAIDDVLYSEERRARSYLHSNCANCHQPGGPGGGNMDLRISATLAEMGVCNEAPLSGNLGRSFPILVEPGQADNSILALRMENLGRSRMPPLGTAEADTQAMTVIKGWINGLTGCD